MDLKYPRKQRITRALELGSIQQEGKRLRATCLTARSIASPLGFMRVGLVVPKHGKNAVDRNRLKRRLRELVRTVLLPNQVSYDVVIRVRPNAYTQGFDDLQKEMTTLAQQIVTQVAVPGRA